MPAIILPRRWRRQPPYRVQIDWSNPITYGLVSAPVFSAGVAGMIDAVAPTAWAASSVTLATSTQGLVSSFSGGSSVLTNTYNPIAAAPFSMAVFFNLSNITANHVLFDIGLASDSTKTICFMAAGGFSGDPLLIYNSSGGAFDYYGSLAYSANVWQFASCVFRTTTGTIRLDKTEQSVTNRFWATVSTLDTLRIGRAASLAGGISVSTNGAIGSAYLWNRELTLSEHLALTENPWQIFKRNNLKIISLGQTTHILTGENSKQANASLSGVLTQTHTLVGANAAWNNKSSNGSLGQTNALTGGNSSQINAASSGVIIQTYVLLGASNINVLRCSGGSISLAALLLAVRAILKTETQEVGQWSQKFEQIKTARLLLPGDSTDPFRMMHETIFNDPYSGATDGTVTNAVEIGERLTIGSAQYTIEQVTNVGRDVADVVIRQ